MEITIARMIHILGVVFWIGGVAMVTTVIIPAVRKMRTKEERLETFEKIEGRFSLQARVFTLVTGLSGFYMLYELNAWNRYLEPAFWWIHAMTFVWLLFSLILFVLEPLVLHRLFRKKALENPELTFKWVERAHWILLLISLVTILGAVAGSHGLYFF